MTKEEIIEIAKQIGIKKGYRIDFPEDWYGGISFKELKNNNVVLSLIAKNFKGINSIIKYCFPKHDFLEWKFKNVKAGFWDKQENVVIYLKWLESELNWDSPEDWYNISLKTLLNNSAKRLITKYNFKELPNILYPNYKFDKRKFKRIVNGYWENFENLKNVIMEFYKINNRAPLFKECKDLKIDSAVQKHGGIIKISKQLNISTTTQFLTLSGDVVKSMYEVIFANFCFLNNIQFQYEVKLIKSKKYNCDFKIDDFYIEIWGCGERGSIGKHYIKQRKIKEIIYKDNKLKLINLEHVLFDNNKLKTINFELISLMSKIGIKNNNFYNNDLNKLNFFSSFNKETIFKEIKQECIKRKFNVFPTFDWWRDNGFKKHLRFIETNKISIHDLAKICNLQSAEKPKNYWKNWQNIENEILVVYKELLKFPSEQFLRKIKKGIIAYSILKYHGGFKIVREQFKKTHNII